MQKSECGAGLTGILTNFSAYQRWVKTTHERAQYGDVTYATADRKSDFQGGFKHKDLRKAQIQMGEKHLTQAIAAVNSFLNAFEVSDQDKLYCLSSGAPVVEMAEKDIMKAESVGKQAKGMFITDRLEAYDNFFEPVKKLRLKNFQSSNKTVKLKTAQNNNIQTA